MSSSKSNFAQTCNLLSQYIKEKGSLRDLNLEIGGNIESLEAIVKHGSSHSASASTTDKGKSAQPSTEQQPSMVPDSSINTAKNVSYEPTSKEATKTDPKAAQLTIFYSGRVLVFDDYPADKAEELVAFAKKGSFKMSSGILSNTLGEKPIPGAVASTSAPREGIPSRPHASSISHKAFGITSNTCKENLNTATGGAEAQPTSSTVEKRVSSQTEANDLPIARRSSLHRFLEKRKDRAAARGPFEVQEQPVSSSRGDEQLELKL